MAALHLDKRHEHLKCSNLFKTSLVVIIILMMLLITPARYREVSSTSLLATSQVKGPTTDGSRPIMHTFFEEVPGGCCGASSSGHNNLLNAWKSAWERAGWDTKILTIEDSKKNSYFDSFERVVAGLQIDDYNKRCFYRWFAMANTEGGGWMSDYDLFPLNISIKDGLNLPNNGQFTSFEGSVPSLLSASEAEWNRMASLIIETIKIHKGILSDMYVLDTIRQSKDLQDGSIFVLPRIAVVQGFLYDEKMHVDCMLLSGMKALHLSHESTNAAVQHAIYPINATSLQDALENRGKAAEIYLSDWDKQCKAPF